MSRHRKDRLQWARQHVQCAPNEWRAFLFTDESKFSLESDSKRYLIRRKIGTRYYPSNIRERYACGRGNDCVWIGISLDERTDLYVLQKGTVNAEVYKMTSLMFMRAHMPGQYLMLSGYRITTQDHTGISS